MPYKEYVPKHVLAPLRMERSFFSKVEKDPDAATPYIITREGGEEAVHLSLWRHLLRWCAHKQCA